MFYMMCKINYKNLQTIPFLFTQTREDSEIEINEINKCTDSTILLIGSSGDTVLNVLSKKNSINRIDVIDLNINQLHLTKLKIALYQNYEKTKLNIILNNNDKSLKAINYKCILNDLYLKGKIEMTVRDYWYENIKYLENGINFEGRFEKLFKLANDNGNYNLYFSNYFLKKLFGNKAVKHSKEKSFIKHFVEINRKYENCDNYFKDSFRENKYVNNMPPYLENNCQINTNICYYLRDLYIHCVQCNDEIYDIIHMSNIIDWTDPLMFQDLFDNIFRVLKKNGKIILRKLNSDVVMVDYLEKTYKKSYIFKIKIVNDRSQFYSETIIIKKINVVQLFEDAPKKKLLQIPCLGLQSFSVI